MRDHCRTRLPYRLRMVLSILHEQIGTEILCHSCSHNQAGSGMYVRSDQEHLKDGGFSALMSMFWYRRTFTYPSYLQNLSASFCGKCNNVSNGLFPGAVEKVFLVPQARPRT